MNSTPLPTPLLNAAKHEVPRITHGAARRSSNSGFAFPSYPPYLVLLASLGKEKHDEPIGLLSPGYLVITTFLE